MAHDGAKVSTESHYEVIGELSTGTTFDPLSFFNSKKQNTTQHETIVGKMAIESVMLYAIKERKLNIY